MIHVAGAEIQYENLVRQRCLWCGALLVQYDVTRYASMDGKPPTVWAYRALVAVDGEASWEVAPQKPNRGEARHAPAESCFMIDPAVTR
jgi:hypothetical protein